MWCLKKHEKSNRLIHASYPPEALSNTHKATGLAYSKSSRRPLRLKKILSSLRTIPTNPIISKVISMGITKSDMLPLHCLNLI
nr:MAG TPA: hypothetical protein [Bacteriophage sp.]